MIGFSLKPPSGMIIEVIGEVKVSAESTIHYVSDADGNAVSVIVPIELWREIESERETAYLLKSDATKRRLTDALQRTDGLTIEEVRAKLGN